MHVMAQDIGTGRIPQRSVYPSSSRHRKVFWDVCQVSVHGSYSRFVFFALFATDVEVEK